MLECSIFLNIFNILNTLIVSDVSKIKKRQQDLQTKYKQLVEQAYNFRQTDHALSDLSEYNAIKLLHKLNRIKYLNRESTQPFLHS